MTTKNDRGNPGRNWCSQCMWYVDNSQHSLRLGWCGCEVSNHYGHCLKDWHPACPSYAALALPLRMNLRVPALAPSMAEGVENA